VSVFLHTISDFERLGDHAVNISNSAQELNEKKMRFSEDARAEIGVLQSAVQEILDLTVQCFCEDDLKTAMKVEPLRELINHLCTDLKTRHINRLRTGKCELKQGFAFNNMLTDYERIAAHCSNVAIAMLELEAASFDTHKYQKSIRELNNEEYTACYEAYEAKYSLAPAPETGKKAKKVDKPAKSDKPGKADKTDKIDKADRSDKQGKSGKTDKFDKPDKNKS
jgi:phosphate:Na+ symporter